MVHRHLRRELSDRVETRVAGGLRLGNCLSLERRDKIGRVTRTHMRVVNGKAPANLPLQGDGIAKRDCLRNRGAVGPDDTDVVKLIAAIGALRQHVEDTITSLQKD